MKDYNLLPKYYSAGYPMPFFSFFDVPSQNNIKYFDEEPQDNSVNSKVNIKPHQKHRSLSSKSKNNFDVTETNNEVDSKWPVIDIIEYATKYVVEAEVPGFQKKDILIGFESSTGVLIIQGNWTEPIIKSPDLVMVEDEEGSDDESTEKKSMVCTSNSHTLNGAPKKILAERRSQRNFKRSLKIRERVDSEKITASLNDGILILDIPKIKDEKRHNIIIS